MTKEEFIEDHRHELGGWILDAATAMRTGGELAVSIRQAMRRIDARLSMMFDQLTKDQKTPPPKRTA